MSEASRATYMRTWARRPGVRERLERDMPHGLNRAMVLACRCASCRDALAAKESERIDRYQESSQAAPRRYRLWSAEEDEFLKSNLAMSAARVGETLGRSVWAVKQRRRTLGMRCTRWQPGDVQTTE